MPPSAKDVLLLAVFGLVCLVLPLNLKVTPESVLTLPTLLLLLLNIFFYLSSRVALDRKTIVTLSALSLTLLAGSVFAREQPINAGYLLQLLTILWSIPLLQHLIKPPTRRLTTALIIIAIGLHATWGLAQFIMQKDFGLQKIGETNLEKNLPGIARFTIQSEHKLIRAYGPYPHPNIFAGTLVLGIILLLSLKKPPVSRSAYLLIYTLLLLALLATFSRAGLIAFLIYCLFWIFQTQSSRPKAILILISLIVITLFLPLFLNRATDKEDVAASERALGWRWGIQVIQNNEIWQGVGPGQYKSALTRHLKQRNITPQPWQIDTVHSIPVLMLAEWGIVLTALVVILLRRVFLESKIIPLLIALLPILLLDHYLLTHPAPLFLLLSIAIALSGARPA